MPNATSKPKSKENVPVGQDDHDTSDMDVDSNDQENFGKEMLSDQKAKKKDSLGQGDLNDQSKDKDSVGQSNLDGAEMEVENIVNDKNDKGYYSEWDDCLLFLSLG